MSKVAEQLLAMVGNPDHCGDEMDLRCAHLETAHGPHTLKIGVVCKHCLELTHKVVKVTNTAEIRELLGGDDYWNEDVVIGSSYKEVTPTAEEVAGEDGVYYCNECDHNHRVDSNVGQDHLEYAAEE